MTEIGYCSSCLTQICPTPNTKGSIGVNCSFWDDGEEDKATSEHWDCAQCGEILFIETAKEHQCSAESIAMKKKEDARLPDWAR